MITKKIKDFVHGYIPIERDIISNFVDTPSFQRLRRIEQTSMRALYPSARHDRFIHSLGTFYLGSVAIDYIKKNSDVTISDVEYKSFLLACLLHDCGHSPFSHTFEDCFNPRGCLLDLLKEVTSDVDNLYKDIECNADAASHEYLSAIIAINIFGEQIEQFGGDPVLVARMITGITYSDDNIRNPLIGLLNGRAIDVDKLDYTIRDLAISGIKHINVDSDRLLSSMLIVNNNNRFRLCFKKNALSAINSVVEVKNFLARWVFSHHIVQYDQYLLKSCVKELACKKYSSANEDEAMEQLFSPYSFLPQLGESKGQNVDIPLLCDDDLIYLLKKYNVPHADEWLYRQYKMRPVWKTHIEFFKLFELKSIKMDQREIVNIISKTLSNTETFIIIMQKNQRMVIEYQKLYVEMKKNDICTAKDLGMIDSSSDDKFFYLFIDKKVNDTDVKKVIDDLKHYLS